MPTPDQPDPSVADPAALRGERMARQHLIGPPLPDVVEVVRHLTAVQAQEFDDVCRAVARRAQGWPAAADVAAVVASGPVVRHHVLRPTWHLVLAEELDWLLDLTAERLHAKARSQYRSTGILDDLDRLVGLVGEVVAESVSEAGEPPTRKEVGQALAARGHELPSSALLQLTYAAELERVVVNGPRRGSWDTFVPYRSRVPEGEALTHDEAVTRLAARYLESHAPATPEDFAWWSGLTLTDARRAFETVGPVEPVAASATGTAMLISLFDEYVIAYVDRDLYAAPTARGGTIDVWGGNLAVVDGVAVGTWRLRKAPSRSAPARLEITPTAPVGAATRKRLEDDAHHQLHHHETPYEIHWKEAA